MVLVQFSLAQKTVQDLKTIDPNVTEAIEWIVRYYQCNGYPTPFYPRDHGLRVVVSANLSPYVLSLLKQFGIYGLNPSKTIDWLVKMYVSHSSPVISEVSEVKGSKIKDSKPKTKKRSIYVSTNKPKIVPRR